MQLLSQSIPDVPLQNRKRRICRRLLILAILAILFWLVGSYAVAHRLTRRPHAPCEEAAPAIAWGTVQELRLATEDGEDLGAWFIAGGDDRPMVLLLHGNGCSRGSCLDEAKLVAEAGCSVLMLSMRAHGDSTGETNDFGLSARQDVCDAVRWLEEHYSDRAIVIWGRSLGAAAALFASKELGERVSGYILECPYRDLRTAVRNRTRRSLPFPLDSIAYAGLSLVSPLVLSDIDRISPLEASGDIPKSVPVLILAGGKDDRARADEASEIRERIGSMAELVVVENGDHLELLRADPNGMRDAVRGFLALSDS